MIDPLYLDPRHEAAARLAAALQRLADVMRARLPPAARAACELPRDVEERQVITVSYQAPAPEGVGTRAAVLAALADRRPPHVG